MRRALVAILGFVITALATISLLVVVKDKQARHVIHTEILAEVRSIISLVGNIPPNGLCELEQSELMWGDVDHLLRKASRLGAPISFDEIGGERVRRARREVAARYAVKLVKVFDMNAKVACWTSNPDGIQLPELYFGQNSRTLLAAWSTIGHTKLTSDEIGMPIESVQMRATDLMKKWILARRTGRDPRADNSIYYITQQMGISANDLGLSGDEWRSYFLGVW